MAKNVRNDRNGNSPQISQPGAPKRGHRLERWIVVALLASHVVMLAFAATRHSPTYDELAHLAAGLYHWKTCRFDLSETNPPLPRMIAAIPLLFCNVKMDWDDVARNPTLHGFEEGEELLANNREQFRSYLIAARWSCIPISLVGAAVCYRWGTALAGWRAGVLSLVLWSFSPNILGHAQLITPDVATTSFGVLAAYKFWRWLQIPGVRSTALAGCCLGLALLCKSSWVILLGIWPMIWLAWCLSSPRSDKSPPLRQLVFLLLLGLYVVNLGYFFEGTFVRLDRLPLRSHLLAPITQHAAEAVAPRLRTALPASYLVGLDTKIAFLETPHMSYLSGNWRDGGWWYYYIYCFAVKVPSPVFLLAVTAMVKKAWPLRDILVLIGPAMALIIIVSSQTNLNRHFRYVLPALPFLFIWCGTAARTRINGYRGQLVAFSTTWFVASSLFTYPHSLSYFNEMAGGPLHGSEHLLDSNLDWGQDLFYLQRYLKTRDDIRQLNLAYFGSFDPAKFGVDYTFPLEGSNKQPRLERQLRPGWYAISTNFLHGFEFTAPRGDGTFGIVPSDCFEAFRDQPPTARCGYSISIYCTPGRSTETD